jgi:hypothetical protein
MKKVKCSHPECDFQDEFQPDDFGLNYFQAIGLCPQCDEPTVYAATGEPTLKLVNFIVTPQSVIKLTITAAAPAPSGAETASGFILRKPIIVMPTDDDETYHCACGAQISAAESAALGGRCDNCACEEALNEE